MNKHLAIFATSAFSSDVLSGCSTTHQQMDVPQSPEYLAQKREQAETKNTDARISELENEIAGLQNQDSSLQTALNQKSRNPCPIEGMCCFESQTVITDYQQIQTLARGHLTINTLRRLGMH